MQFLKRIFFSISISICSLSVSKAILKETIYQGFTYIVDTENKTATLSSIWIPFNCKQEIRIPCTVLDCLNFEYIVTQVNPESIKLKIDQIISVEFPHTLEYTDLNEKTLDFLFLMGIPVKRNVVSVVDFFGFNFTFKKAFFPSTSF